MDPRRVLKIDLHTHILPENLPDLTERYGTPGFIQLDHHAPGCARMILDGTLFREIQDNCWDARRRLEDCAATHVDVQVLSFGAPGPQAFGADIGALGLKGEDVLRTCHDAELASFAFFQFDMNIAFYGSHEDISI